MQGVGLYQKFLGGMVLATFLVFLTAPLALAQTADTPVSNTDSQTPAPPATAEPTDANAATSTDSSAGHPEPTIATEVTDSADATVTTQLTTTATPTDLNKPFYQDMRYLVLIVDGIIVISLIIALTLRLVSRAVESAQPAGSGSTPATPNEHPTVDQLNVDIPL